MRAVSNTNAIRVKIKVCSGGVTGADRRMKWVDGAPERQKSGRHRVKIESRRPARMQIDSWASAMVVHGQT